MPESVITALPAVTSPTAVHRRVVPAALALLSDQQPCALLYDLDGFKATLASIQTAFTPSTIHAVAMKANPLVATLELARDMGMGCEVASPAELEHALRLGFVPGKIVMDSPAKTRRDLRRALRAGVHLNADNLEELERIDEILTNEFGGGGTKGLGSCTSSVGVRVNPQYGEGAIAATGTIAKTSKFGVPLLETRTALLECYGKYSWLTAVHCHVGSQGCAVELLVKGAKSVVDLADEINEHVGGKQVRTLDIGGGMPVDYSSDAPDTSDVTRVTPRRFAAALRDAVPSLFDERQWTVITEFGRYVSAKAGVMLSRVEYVKSAGGRRIATIHCGADLFLRTAYQPSNWPHRVSAWSHLGEFIDPRDGPTEVCDVVGPLCFRGDIVATAVPLPSRLTSGDAILVHDAGAYTLAMFSRYNSRQAPPVYGFSDGGSTVTCLSAGETVDEALRMWQKPRKASRRVSLAALALAAAAGALVAGAVARRV
jgi:diaminopimelate decarboxylase